MKVKDFKEIVTMLGHILSKSELPILENVFLEPGKLIVSDFQNELEVDFDHQAEGFFPFDKLKKFVTALDNSDIIGFSHSKEKGHVYLTINGKIEAKFDNEYPTDEWPKQKEVVSVIQENHLSRETIFKMNEALSFLSNDDLRPAMKCVALSDMVAGTDGNTLFFDKIEGEPFKEMVHNVTKNFNDGVASFTEYKSIVLVSKKVVNLLMRSKQTFKVTVASTVGDVKIEGYGSFPSLQEAVVIFEATGIKLTHRMMFERFPDYKNVVPQMDKLNHFELIFEKPEFEKSIKLALIQANKTNAKVSFHPQSDQLVRIKSGDLDYGTEFNRAVKCKVEPIHNVTKGKYILEDGTEEQREIPMPEIFNAVAYNGNFLLKISKLITAKYITMQTNAPNRAAIINGKYLIMPVMLNDNF